MKKWLNDIERLPSNPRGTDYSSEIEKWKKLDKESLWRGIKACTEGEARKILESTVEEDGYEAWFELNRNFEPAMEAKRIRAVGDVYSMHSWKAKTTTETRSYLTELEKRRRVAVQLKSSDGIDETLSDAALIPIMQAFLDEETKSKCYRFL